jgi:acetate---CoA ligase (ADP-forming)
MCVCDIDALAQMAARLSWLAYDLRDDIAELDLNPVIVLPQGQGAFAVDALVVTRWRAERTAIRFVGR